MWRQQLLLLWNRRKGNALIVAEVVLAAILLFVITAIALHYWSESRSKLGFEYEDVSLVWLTRGFPTDPNHNQRVDQILDVVRAQPAVASASAGGMALFAGWRSTSEWDEDGRLYKANMNNFELEADEVLDLDIVDGRWFDESDLGSTDVPAVVNLAFAKESLGKPNVVGETFPAPGGDDENRRQAKVVGVLSAFKQYSQLEPDTPYMITLTDTSLPQSVELESRYLLYLVVRKVPSAPASFAGDLTRALKGMAPDMPVRVESLSDMRERDMVRKLRPLRIGALISGFFLLLVCFGLFGIFWQSVTTRTKELGLKRALGLSSPGVIRHFILEHGMLSLAALIIASALLAHLPLTGWLDYVNWSLFASSLAIVWLLIGGLTAICAAYPAWQASRISPADALHYE